MAEVVPAQGLVPLQKILRTELQLFIDTESIDEDDREFRQPGDEGGKRRPLDPQSRSAQVPKDQHPV